MNRWVVATTAFVVLAGSTTAAWAQELRLGLITAKSGVVKSLAETTRTAVDLAVEQINAAGGINGKKVRIIEFDTGSDPKQAQVGTRTLAQDENVLAIIGPFTSAEARVAFPVGEQLGIVQIPNASSAPGLTEGKSFAFRMTESEVVQFNRLLASMKKKDILPKRAAVMYVSDEFVSKIVGTKIMPVFLEKSGVELVSEPVGFPGAAFDLAPQVSKLMQKDPEMLAVGGLPDAAVKALAEMRRQGFEGRLIGSQLFSDPDIINLFGETGEGSLFAAGFWRDFNDETRDFTKKFNDLNGKRGIKQAFPHHVDAQAYDTVLLLAQVLNETGVTGEAANVEAERIAIRDGIRTTQFNGLLGPVCFDENGDAELPGFIIEIKDGDWTLFDSHPANKCG